MLPPLFARPPADPVEERRIRRLAGARTFATFSTEAAIIVLYAAPPAGVTVVCAASMVWFVTPPAETGALVMSGPAMVLDAADVGRALVRGRRRKADLQHLWQARPPRRPLRPPPGPGGPDLPARLSLLT